MLTKFKQCFTIDKYNSIVQTFIFSITLIVPSYLKILIVFTLRIFICYQYIHHYSHKYHGSSCKMEHKEAHVSYRNISLMASSLTLAPNKLQYTQRGTVNSTLDWCVHVVFQLPTPITWIHCKLIQFSPDRNLQKDSQTVKFSGVF